MSKATKRVHGRRSADSAKGSADSVTSVGKHKSLRLVILFLVLLVVLGVAVVWKAPTRLVNSYARGSLQRFDDEGAMAWLRFSEKWFPNNFERELILARIARRSSEYAEMDRHLSKARALGADLVVLQMEEAMAAAQSGAIDIVEKPLFKWLENGIGEADEISDAYCNGLAANSRFDRIETILSAWEEDYPSDPRPDYRRARMHEYGQDWVAAEAYYRKSLQKNKGFLASRYRLGRVLMLERKMEEALEQFVACADMPRPEAALTSLAICYRSTGESEKAREILQQVLAKSIDEIEKSYRAVEEVHEYFEAASNFGDLESEAGNLDAAEKWLRAAITKNDRDLQSRYSLAVTLRQLGRIEEAQKEFDAVATTRKILEQVNPLRNRIGENPKDPAPRVELGELLLNHESERSGQFWINSAFAIDANYRPAHEALARFYRKKSANDRKYAELATFHEQAATIGSPTDGQK